MRAPRRHGPRPRLRGDEAAEGSVIGPILLIGIAVLLVAALALAYAKLDDDDVPVTRSGAKAVYGEGGYFIEPTGPNDIPVAGSRLFIAVNGGVPVSVPLSNFSATLGNATTWAVGQRLCIVGDAASCWTASADRVEVTLYTRYNYVFRVEELLAQDPPFTLSSDSSGSIVVQTHGVVTIRNVGAQLTCGANGPTIPITAEYTVDGGANFLPLFNGSQINPNGGQLETLPSVPIGAVLGARGNSLGLGGCDPVSYQSIPSDPHVQVLGPGDPAPDKAPFGGQGGLATYLEPYVNTATKTMVLDYNQVILLFEFSSDISSGNSAADFQDLVLLFTFG